MGDDFRMIQKPAGQSLPALLRVGGWIVIGIGVVGCLYILASYNRANRGFFEMAGRGSGLTTQAVILAAAFGLYHFAFGILGIGLAECVERTRAFSGMLESSGSSPIEGIMSRSGRASAAAPTLRTMCPSCHQMVHAGPEHPFCAQCGERVI